MLIHKIIGHLFCGEIRTRVLHLTSHFSDSNLCHPPMKNWQFVWTKWIIISKHQATVGSHDTSYDNVSCYARLKVYIRRPYWACKSSVDHFFFYILCIQKTTKSRKKYTNCYLIQTITNQFLISTSAYRYKWMLPTTCFRVWFLATSARSPSWWSSHIPPTSSQGMRGQRSKLKLSEPFMGSWPFL